MSIAGCADIGKGKAAPPVVTKGSLLYKCEKGRVEADPFFLGRAAAHIGLAALTVLGMAEVAETAKMMLLSSNRQGNRRDR